MSSSSKIEWTEHTWNPVVGCSIVSPGCTNCYAMRMAARIEAMNDALAEKTRTHGTHYAGTTKKVKGKAVWTGHLAMAPEETLLAPLRRKVPTTYFVNSMGDLFHEDCPDTWIDRVFAVMALCPQHTFQVLTKRAARMRSYFEAIAAEMRTLNWTGEPAPRFDPIACQLGMSPWSLGGRGWPLPNIWLGVSCERQEEADERIPLLLQTPAAIRFISAEPLLGPISLAPKADAGYQRLSEWYGKDGFDETGSQPRRERRTDLFPKLDWVIVGGESGPHARPMHPQWARDLRDQCEAAGVEFFFKQWGEHRWIESRTVDNALTFVVERVGKKAAGRLLDGIEHNGMPGVRA